MRLQSILSRKVIQVKRQCMDCQWGNHCGNCGCCKGHAAPALTVAQAAAKVCETNLRAGRLVRGWNG